jgi:hypothetical protein
MINRRGLLLGLGAMFAAPAIVRVQSLMKLPAHQLLEERGIWEHGWEIVNPGAYEPMQWPSLYIDIYTGWRNADCQLLADVSRRARLALQEQINKALMEGVA